MSRATNSVASRRRKRRVLKKAKGFWGDRKNHQRITQEAVQRSMANSYKDRKKKKSNFRQLWITRIGIAAKINGMSYSKLVHGLRLSGCEVDRKMLAELAVNHPKSFADLAEHAKNALVNQ